MSKAMTDLRTIIAIDQGTTSSRAILFDEDGTIMAQQSTELPQHFPADGWVEHNPEDIWQTTVDVTSAMVAEARSHGSMPLAIGITNQRETAIIWDRATGKPIHNAIVWQDRRTADICALMKNAGSEAKVTEKTGLLLDPYFTATKFSWILDKVGGARDRAAAGELCFGTVDSFLIWRLTGGRMHVTDATNASRTSLYNIHENGWDDELLALFDVPRVGLPQVMDCAAEFGVCDNSLFGTDLPICGVAGDQQAAAIGQGCFTPGALKSTYGTGCFVIINTGDEAVVSKNKLLTTIGYRLGGRTTYALEGSIFVSGAIVQWLRDGMKLIASASETGAIAAAQGGNNGVYMVPALTGLGAPHWMPEARGLISGLSFVTEPAHLARAAAESLAQQVSDIFDVVNSSGRTLGHLSVDGGPSENRFLMQLVADLLDHPLTLCRKSETSGIGAAFLAGLATGFWPDLSSLRTLVMRDATITSNMLETTRNGLRKNWQEAIVRTTLSP